MLILIDVLRIAVVCTGAGHVLIMTRLSNVCTARLHLTSETEDLEQSLLYSHPSAELEEEMGQVEGRAIFCQGANVEHHVPGEEG